ncbi:MAG: iron-siderophore ABC transporter substrate-binding protein [Kiloniellales bacterium]|nr:iron-siderophore ABC transporter substrate-binding protein [Kiloniellales bacterium]
MTALTRRRLLAVAGALPLAGATDSWAADPRIVALEWRYADHARSLGILPVGVADLAQYLRQASVDTATLRAAGTLDMGRRQEPSIEAVIDARPSLILGVDFRHRRIGPQLAAIAETILFDYTQTGRKDADQLALMLAELDELAGRAGRKTQAVAAVEAFDLELGRLAGALASRGLAGDPIVFAQFPRGVNAVRLFTAASLPGRLLSRLGLKPAWDGPSEGFGFTTVGPERLLALGDVHFLGVAVGDDNSYARLAENPLWRALPFVRAGKFHVLADVVWPFGGLPAALSFSGSVVEALAR